MAKKYAFFYVLIGIVIGFIFGAIGAAYALSQFMADAAYSKFSGDATLQLAALEKLEMGDVGGATLILESALENNEVALLASGEITHGEQNEINRRLLDRIKIYRGDIRVRKPRRAD